ENKAFPQENRSTKRHTDKETNSLSAFPLATSMANSTVTVVKGLPPGPAGRSSPEGSQVLSKKKLQDLVREIDPNEQLDEDVEEMLLQIADDFIESVVTAACQLARHRKSNTLEVKDVQLHLERQWNMWIPGYGSDEIRPFKKACTTEAHKQVSDCLCCTC
uniref:Transcription initiation factor TFIID subunit 12 n=1 Tax=Haplochromis burtoni TaxID=8153 RepID=A0A3Q2VW56_HAPBU